MERGSNIETTEKQHKKEEEDVTFKKLINSRKKHEVADTKPLKQP